MCTSLINQLLITHSSKTTKYRLITCFCYSLTFYGLVFFFLFVLFGSFILILAFGWFQTRPGYHPEGLYDENKVSAENKETVKPITQLWHMNGQCPEETIPIRRTKKDDVLRASSVKRYGKKKRTSIPQPRSADPDLINQSGHQVNQERKNNLFGLTMVLDLVIIFLQT